MTAAWPMNKLAIHTRTTRNWDLRSCCAKYQQAGIGGVSVWRELIDPAQGGVSPDEARRIIVDAGLVVPALVRAGFFVSADTDERTAAIDDARVAIRDAQTIGAEQIVLVVGASPGVPLEHARSMVCDAVVAIADDAAQANLRLAIEPLHPMYASDRSCINTLANANDICAQIAHPQVGVALDVYHLWWEPGLATQIMRAGQAGRIFGVHICDWKTTLSDPLNDRGLMGDGCIDIANFMRSTEAAGFDGMFEVEVFSESYWAMDPDQYLALIIDRFSNLGTNPSLLND